MKLFSERPLGQKMLIVVTATSLLSVCLASSMWFLNDWYAYREITVRNARVLANVIAFHVSAALNFRVQEDAETALRALQAKPEILEVTVFDSQGKLFARYSPEGSGYTKLPSNQPNNSDTIVSRDELIIIEDIKFEKDIIGHILIRTSLAEVYDRAMSGAFVCLLIILTSLVLSLLLSSKIQKVFFSPLRDLLEVTKRVRATKAFNIRAPRRVSDEIGLLVDGFNEMLAELEARDRILAENRENLERSVEARTAELQTAHKAVEQQLINARDTAEALAKVKSEFLANMSHEIRTPLNGIFGTLRLVLKSNLDNKQRTLIQMMKSSADSLLQIVNDVLDFSRLEAGKVSIEAREFNLREMLTQTLGIYQARAAEQSLQFDIKVNPEVPEIIVGDSLRLGQILSNLVSNALKFTPQGGVEVRVSQLEGSAGRCKIEFAVADTGIGIAPEKQDFVFEAFAQVDSSATRTAGGTGLGLSIISRLVNLMGGKVSLESTPGSGSIFRVHLNFELPYERLSLPGDELADLFESPAIPERPDSELLTVEGLPLSVLLAEDNVINQKIAQESLESFGCKVDIAANGKIAVDMVATKAYSMIFMDIQMPEMDGLAATLKIRELDRMRGKRSPIIAMTAHALEGDRERCIAAGMDYYIAKPIDDRNLREIIVQILKE